MRFFVARSELIVALVQGALVLPLAFLLGPVVVGSWVLASDLGWIATIWALVVAPNLVFALVAFVTLRLLHERHISPFLAAAGTYLGIILVSVLLGPLLDTILSPGLSALAAVLGASGGTFVGACASSEPRVPGTARPNLSAPEPPRS